MGRPSTRYSWCEHHGKRGYHDPAAAADALSSMPDRAVMRAYPCETHPPTLHIGHDPRTVALEQLNKAGDR